MRIKEDELPSVSICAQSNACHLTLCMRIEPAAWDLVQASRNR